MDRLNKYHFVLETLNVIQMQVPARHISRFVPSPQSRGINFNPERHLTFPSKKQVLRELAARSLAPMT